MPAILVIENDKTINMQAQRTLQPGRFIQRVKGEAQVDLSQTAANPGIVTAISISTPTVLTSSGVDRVFVLQLSNFTKAGSYRFEIILREPGPLDNSLLFECSASELISRNLIILQSQFLIDSIVYTLQDADLTTRYDTLAILGSGFVYL